MDDTDLYKIIIPKPAPSGVQKSSGIGTLLVLFLSKVIYITLFFSCSDESMTAENDITH